MTPEVSLFQLFWIFFYIGTFTIGGGLVAITLMQQTLVTRGLISASQFYNMVAVSESTPGPMGINMATYIGYQLYGVPGGIIVTLGEVAPSIICIIIIAHFFSKFHEKPAVQAAFTILRPATTGIILVAAVQVFVVALMHLPASFKDLALADTWIHMFTWPALAFYALGVVVLFKTKIHPVIVIAAGAVFGMLFM